MSTHNRNKRSRRSARIVSIAACLVAILSYVYSTYLTGHSQAEASQPAAPAAAAVAAGQQHTATAATADIRYELPQVTDSRSQQIIEHLAYTVSYNHDWHLPNWVAYELTHHEVGGDNSRSDKFLPDPLVDGDPVVSKDYSRSGYDRGHMAPAGDMKWSDQAMRESFYMTNMCPQNHNNNAGDWKDLEELVRDLATAYGNVYVCCGPIVTDASHTIGDVRKIVVPQSFYKVLLRKKSDGRWTAIGFVMDNAPANRPLMTYMLPVDEVEQLARIDFFCQLPDSVEASVEADYTVADWTVKQ